MQWGHRLSAMETTQARWQGRAPDGASMGPPPFGDGNKEKWDADRAAREQLQWGHRLSAMETGIPPQDAIGLRDASMGPPPFGDGNTCLWRHRGPVGWSFNGATAFRRWKHGSDEDHDDDHDASMGPPPFGDGNPTAGGRSRRARSCFNGATAFRRWKLVPTTGFQLKAIDRLQWGHRLSAMETIVIYLQLVNVSVASMGPPPFGDGNSGQGPS